MQQSKIQCEYAIPGLRFTKGKKVDINNVFTLVISEFMRIMFIRATVSVLELTRRFEWPVSPMYTVKVDLSFHTRSLACKTFFCYQTSVDTVNYFTRLCFFLSPLILT